MDDSDRFVTAMQQTVGKRLTYKELTGKTIEESDQTADVEPVTQEWEPF